MAVTPIVQVATEVELKAPWLAGYVLSLFLAGIFFTMCDNFFRRATTESTALRVLVAGLILATVVEMGASAAMIGLCLFPSQHEVIYICARASGEASAIAFASQDTIAALSQSFFAHKAYKLSASLYALLFMALCILATAGSALVMIIVPFTSPLSPKTFITALYVHKSLAAVTNVLISLIFVRNLRQHSSQVPMFASTGGVITKLLALSLQTASATSVLALASIIMSAARGSASYWSVVANYLLSKTYAISAVYVINQRRALRAAIKSSATFAQSTTRGGKPVVADDSEVEDTPRRQMISFRLPRRKPSFSTGFTGIHVHLETLQKVEQEAQPMKSLTAPRDAHLRDSPPSDDLADFATQIDSPPKEQA